MSAGLQMPSFADLSPEIQAQILAQLQQPGVGSPEVPDATFKGFQPPTPPTGAPTPVNLSGYGVPAQGSGPGPQGASAGPQASPLLAGVLSGAPSMLGGQMGAPEMPAPSQQDATAADASPLSRMPTLLGLQPPQMPANGNNGRPAGIPPNAKPASAAAGASPDVGDGEGTPPSAGLTAPKPPTAYTALPGAKPVAPPSVVPGAPAPAVTAPATTGPTAPAAGSTTAPGARTGPANAAPTVEGPSFLQRLANAGVGDQMMALGGGLLSGRNFAEGLGLGLQGASRASQAQGATQLAQAKAQAEQAKLLRDQQAQNQTARIIAQRLGMSLDDATALASNPNYVQGFLTSQFGAPQNFRINPDGTQAYVPGSLADPGYKAQEAAAGREPIADAGARAGAIAQAQQAAKPDEPYTMTPGQVRFDPKTNEPIASLPNKPDLTATQNDYEYARRNDGYKGTFQEFMDQRGNASRAQTTFNNTVNPILVAAGDRFQEGLKEANASADVVRSVQSARSQLDAPGGIFTGSFADQQLALQKVGSFLGVADPRAIQNTETFRTQIKPIVLETVKGLGAGSGISNADRDFALEAVGGKITLDEGTIRRVLDITERAARAKIDRHNTVANGLINGDNAATYKPVASALLVQQPDNAPINPAPGVGAGSAVTPQPEAPPQGIMQFRTQTEYAAAPRGTRYIAPDGKMRVKQ